MSFSGNLKTVPFSDILQLIATSRKTGMLKVVRQAQEKMINFVDGDIIYATSEDAEELLGKSFLKKGIISKPNLDDINCVQKNEKKSISKTIMDLGISSQKELSEHLRSQIEEMVYNIFSWDEGEFEFLDGRLPPKEEVTTLLPTMNMIMEGARRIDEWSRIQKVLPPDDAILNLNISPQIKGGKIDLTSDEYKTLLLVDGEKTLYEILEISPLGEFVTSKALSRFIEDGLLMAGDKKQIKKQKIKEEEILFGVLFEVYSRSFVIIEDILERKLGKSKDKIIRDSFLLAKSNFPILNLLMPDAIFVGENFTEKAFTLTEETRLHQMLEGLQNLLKRYMKSLWSFLGKEMVKKTASLIRRETAPIFSKQRELAKKYNLANDFYRTLRLVG